MDSKRALRYLPSMEEKMKVSVKIVKGGESTAQPAECRSEDARGNGIWCIRLRVRPDGSGIDLLPAPDHRP